MCTLYDLMRLLDGSGDVRAVVADGRPRRIDGVSILYRGGPPTAFNSAFPTHGRSIIPVDPQI